MCGTGGICWSRGWRLTCVVACDFGVVHELAIMVADLGCVDVCWAGVCCTFGRSCMTFELVFVSVESSIAGRCERSVSLVSGTLHSKVKADIGVCSLVPYAERYEATAECGVLRACPVSSLLLAVSLECAREVVTSDWW